MTEAYTLLEHHQDHLERSRLLLLRAVVRHWYRAANSTGTLDNLFVSFEELRHELVQGYGENHPPKTSGLPTLEAVEAQLAEHAASMQARLEASAEAGIALPIENLRAIARLSDAELDLVMLLAGLQTDIGLHRVATYTWGDFTIKQPTLGFLAEVVASDRAQMHTLLRCARPSHTLRRLRFLELTPDPRWEGRCPELFLRARLADRVVQELLDPGRPEPHRDIPELARLLEVHSAPRSAEETGQEAEVMRQLQGALRQIARRREPGALVLTGPGHREHADVIKAALGSEAPLVEITLSRALTGRQPPTAEQLATDLACGLREAALRQGHALISLESLLQESERSGLILDALSRVLPYAQELHFVSCDKLIAPLYDVLPAPVVVSVPLPAPPKRLDLWERGLKAASGVRVSSRLERILEDVAYRYALTPRVIEASCRGAIQSARGRGRAAEIAPDDLLQSLRMRLEHQLGLLAEPFSTTLTWDDLVLPEDVLERLQEMIAYNRNKRRVHDAWGFGRLNTYGRGLTALFSGPPGTGKTLTAAIIAREVGCELFRVDLSRIVDKYIGETEKNLARIFDEAERSKAILLFDEADSLFAKRTGVKSSNDRYANLEVNFLLQKMEHFEGTSILTTNLSNEIDDAFMRRIKFRLNFPIPEPEERAEIWRKMLPPEAPATDDIAWDILGEAFDIAPGHIKNAVLRAAFHAAQRDVPIDHELLYESALIEARELGNLVRDE